MQLQDSKLFRQQCYVDGKWTDALNRGTIKVDNPATGETLGTVPRMGAEETRQADELNAAQDTRDAWDQAHETKRLAARAARQELDRRGIEPEHRERRKHRTGRAANSGTTTRSCKYQIPVASSPSTSISGCVTRCSVKTLAGIAERMNSTSVSRSVKWCASSRIGRGIRSPTG